MVNVRENKKPLSFCFISPLKILETYFKKHNNSNAGEKIFCCSKISKRKISSLSCIKKDEHHSCKECLSGQRV